jgi:hypothetical protein
MAFDGPQAADYENVASLNRAFLTVLRCDARSRQGMLPVATEVLDRITELTDRQVERLAAAPFLLLSFREHDDRYWDRVLADNNDRDLFSSTGCDDLDIVVSAGLGFVWQLARQNPYVLRLFCGSSLYWCERIAELTFFRLLASVAAQGSAPVLRHAENRELWSKLLDQGVSVRAGIRTAAQLSALQTILTRSTKQRPPAWARAARSSGRRGLRVADDAAR